MGFCRAGNLSREDFMGGDCLERDFVVGLKNTIGVKIFPKNGLCFN